MSKIMNFCLTDLINLKMNTVIQALHIMTRP